MQPTYRSAAQRLRSDLREGRVTPATFGAALEEIAPSDRDSWLDVLWNIDQIPPDEPELPRGCVPYLPCTAASVLGAVEHAGVSSSDVFVDVGAGLGRAAVLAHLITGANCIGLEIQTPLVRAAQERAHSLKLTRVQFLQGDATDTIRSITTGTVFFLYCPFSGARLERFLDGLEGVARARPIRVCCVDMPPLEVPWLARVPSTSMSVDVYRSLFLG
ncbi:MAG TPA: methyltransferase domain-containing protein [Polyangiaceae bacterium]|nr:methyltransferase domain-containing protein [Polyangiaceae bacterium]